MNFPVESMADLPDDHKAAFLGQLEHMQVRDRSVTMPHSVGLLIVQLLSQLAACSCLGKRPWLPAVTKALAWQLELERFGLTCQGSSIHRMTEACMLQTSSCTTSPIVGEMQSVVMQDVRAWRTAAMHTAYTTMTVLLSC